MENPLAIANFFIRKSIDEGVELTQMKLIKLVYISHGWYLGLTGNPLLPEAVEAWQYGPVVPSIYREFKRFGKSPITELALDYGSLSYPVITNLETIKFLEKIWQVYGKFNGLQLSALTHQKNTPWDITWNHYGASGNRAVPISDELIKRHYIEKKQTSQPANVSN